MIKADGIMAFRGKLVYTPPINPQRNGKVMYGDFVHRQFEDGGYWYGKGSSFSDKYCEVVEDVGASELLDELQVRIDILKNVVVDSGNKDVVEKIIGNVEEWICGVRSKIGG